MKDLIPHPYSYCVLGVPTKCLHECEAIRRREDVFLLYSFLTYKKATVLWQLLLREFYSKVWEHAWRAT